MANLVEYLEPIKLVYTTDYVTSSSDSNIVTVSSVTEFIEITPVVFDDQPTTENLNALPDNCKIAMQQDGIYVLCIKSDYYGTSSAKLASDLYPCYWANYRKLCFVGSESATISQGLNSNYGNLCVYKQSDGRGLRLCPFGTYSIRPENNFRDSDRYRADKLTPGDYVAFKAPCATVTYNGTETTLEAGQTATLACAGKKALGNIVVAFDGAGSITYNMSATEVEAGKTATLQCAGKKMTSDVYITTKQ